MNLFQFKIIMRLLLLIAKNVVHEKRELQIIEQDLYRYYRETE
ncbi:MAG TPA: hypothetical protein PLL95_05030 [Anaerolineales bacterium]|nr:hypothetical protein [Anaerolineales bacterium]